jgi:hypothetical protein
MSKKTSVPQKNCVELSPQETTIIQITTQVNNGTCTSSEKKALILDLYNIPISGETINGWFKAFQHGGEFPLSLRTDEIVNFIDSLDPLEDQESISFLKENLHDHLPLKIIHAMGVKCHEVEEFQELK